MITLETSLDHVKHAGAAMFGLALKARGVAYDSGLLMTRCVEGVKVISVGNIRAGGSGKTPLAIHLAGRLRDAGVPTALLARGYRGKLEASGGLVSRGEGPLVSVDDAGDEAYLAAARLKGVRVRVGEDRIAETQYARDAGARVVVLDDGFQHRRLHRDLDILLVCPEDLDSKTSLLPAGPLRERACAAKRADITAGLARDWSGRASAPELLIEHLPTCLVSREDTAVPLRAYQGARVYLVAGIARPKRFIRTAEEAGFIVAGVSLFRDHHRFRNQDTKAITRKAKAANVDAILTTEKDMVRMSCLGMGLPLWALRIEVQIQSGASILDRELKKVLFY